MKPRITLPEGVLERAVQHGGAHVEEGLHRRSVPAHLLRLVHALGHDLIDRALHERRRDRLATPPSGRVGHQRALVTLEVAQQVADVSLEAADAGHVTHVLALGESRGGVSPPRAPRTVRDTLASYGSRCSAIPMQKAPMRK